MLKEVDKKDDGVWILEVVRFGISLGVMFRWRRLRFRCNEERQVQRARICLHGESHFLLLCLILIKRS